MTEAKVTLLTPAAKWAQRNNVLLFTVEVEDCVNPTVKLEPTTFYFRGTGGSDKKEYELTVELHGEIDPEASKYTVLGREIEFTLKKAKEGFWPRLTKSSSKQHWLKVDFGKWKDEDEVSDEEEGGFGGMGGMGGGMGGGDMDFEKMMRDMGGIGGGAGGPKVGMDDLDDEPETDSDDEALPELE